MNRVVPAADIDERREDSRRALRWVLSITLFGFVFSTNIFFFYAVIYLPAEIIDAALAGTLSVDSILNMLAEIVREGYADIVSEQYETGIYWIFVGVFLLPFVL